MRDDQAELLPSGETLSQNERKLLLALAPSNHWLDLLSKRVSALSYIKVLNILALQCFTEDRRGPEVNALRRALVHLERKTRGAEFDALIVLF